MILSVVIPCYNEEQTLRTSVQRVLDADFGNISKDIVIVDDGSTDQSQAIATEFQTRHPAVVRLLTHTHNQGKGAAVRDGLAVARGDLIVIHDADTEYDPQDFQQMLALFRLPEVDVVFGSRRFLPNPISGMFYYWGAQLINAFTNVLYGARVTDQFTCYKMFRRTILDQLSLRSNGFAVDAEFTAKILRLGYRIYEVPITYHPRSLREGKKIRFHDGVSWLAQIIKYRFLGPRD